MQLVIQLRYTINVAEKKNKNVVLQKFTLLLCVE